MVQQPPLARKAAAEPGERPIRADHAMTRHHDGNRICPISSADRAAGTLAAEIRGELPVTYRSPRRNRTERGPHFTLKRGPGGGGRDIPERINVTIEIGCQRPREGNRRCAVVERAVAIVSAQQLAS